MARIFHIGDDEGYDQRDYGRYNQRDYAEEGDHMLEKAFKEGCEHGYKKAMKELEGYNERGGRVHFKEGFEEKIERLKEKYK